MTNLDNMRVGGPESELRRDAPQSPGVGLRKERGKTTRILEVTRSGSRYWGSAEPAPRL